jgi:hypothetical protein
MLSSSSLSLSEARRPGSCWDSTVLNKLLPPLLLLLLLGSPTCSPLELVVLVLAVVSEAATPLLGFLDALPFFALVVGPASPEPAS